MLRYRTYDYPVVLIPQLIAIPDLDELDVPRGI